LFGVFRRYYFWQNFEEMVENLRKVLSRVQEINLKINPRKCTFFGRKIKYLGHSISVAEIFTDNNKIIAIKKWSIPRNKKHLRNFLRLCLYYHKFVKGFSLLAKSLYALRENQMKFVWNEQYESSFNN